MVWKVAVREKLLLSEAMSLVDGSEALPHPGGQGQAVQEYEARKQGIFVLMVETVAQEYRYKADPYKATNDVKGLWEELERAFAPQTLTDLATLARTFLHASFGEEGYQGESIA